MTKKMCLFLFTVCILCVLLLGCPIESKDGTITATLSGASSVNGYFFTIQVYSNIMATDLIGINLVTISGGTAETTAKEVGTNNLPTDTNAVFTGDETVYVAPIIINIAATEIYVLNSVMQSITIDGDMELDFDFSDFYLYK